MHLKKAEKIQEGSVILYTEFSLCDLHIYTVLKLMFGISVSFPTQTVSSEIEPLINKNIIKIFNKFTFTPTFVDMFLYEIIVTPALFSTS